jgi:hypothetical protein
VTSKTRKDWRFWLKGLLLVACITGGQFGWFLLGCYWGWKIVAHNSAPMNREPPAVDDEIAAAAVAGYWIGSQSRHSHDNRGR